MKAVPVRRNHLQHMWEKAGFVSSDEAEAVLNDPKLVEYFITQNNLDDGAAVALRRAPDHIRDAIIKEGEVINAGNPSACVVARVTRY